MTFDTWIETEMGKDWLGLACQGHQKAAMRAAWNTAQAVGSRPLVPLNGDDIPNYQTSDTREIVHVQHGERP